MAKNKEELIDLLYLKDGEWHTKCSDALEDNEEVELYHQAIADKLSDGEVIIAYDDASTDESCIFIYYKDGANFLTEYLSLDYGVYTYTATNVLWNTDYHRPLNGVELSKYIKALKAYVQEKKLPVHIVLTRQQERIVESPTPVNNLSEKEQDRIINLATFAKTILLLLSLVPAVLVAAFTQNKTWTLVAIGIGIALYGLYYVIGIIFKFKHIFCALQAHNKMQMTPNEINWNMLNGIEKWLRPWSYVVIGIALALISLLV